MTEGSGYQPMKPEVKALWLQALLSGAYRQGEGYLQRNDEYCCLGVLCDVSPAGEWDKDYYGTRGFNGNQHRPPISVMAWAGLDEGAASQLAVLNDHDRYSFEEIAEWIDDNL